MPMVHLARDRAFAGLQHHLRDLRDRNEGAARRREHQISDRLGTAARRRGKADGGVVSPFTDEHLAHGVAADSGLDQIGDVRNVDAVTGAVAARSTLTAICGSGGSWSIDTSAVPGVDSRMSTISFPIRRSSLKSSPNILMTSSLCAPAILSLTPSIMGWLKPTSNPGMVRNFAAMREISFCLVSPDGQVP